jgi:hypothetical protein
MTYLAACRRANNFDSPISRSFYKRVEKTQDERNGKDDGKFILLLTLMFRNIQMKPLFRQQAEEGPPSKGEITITLYKKSKIVFFFLTKPNLYTTQLSKRLIS